MPPSASAPSSSSAPAPEPSAPESPSIGEIERADAAGALATGFRVYGRHFGALLVWWLPVLALDLTLSLSLLAWQRANGLLEEDAAQDVTTNVRFLGIALPLYLLLWTTMLAYWGTAAPLVRGVLARKGVDLLATFRETRARFPVLGPLAVALVVLYLAGGILFLVPFLLVSRTAAQSPAVVAVEVAVAIPLIVPFFVFLHWYLYAPAAAMREGETLAGALGASRKLARERKTAGFTTTVALVVIAAISLAYAASVLATRVVAATAPSWRFVAGEVAFAAADWVLAPLSACIVAAYWVLAEREVLTPPAVPEAAASFTPTPQPASAERPTSSPLSPKRNTRCPGCATVFPYAPAADGAAVRVQCPQCGRVGLVR